MRFTYSQRKMAKLFAKSGDPDQMPHSVASVLDLQCLPVTLLWVSRLQWVNANFIKSCIVVIFVLFGYLNCFMYLLYVASDLGLHCLLRSICSHYLG